MNDTFATSLNCIDGRVQLPVAHYLTHRFGVEHIDTITEPGMVRYVSDQSNTENPESILNSIRISLEMHGSHQIAIVAHDDCSGNPIAPELQQTQLRIAAAKLKQRFSECEVLGLWVDADWAVHELVNL